jgi:ParB-like chromosome segregation protein Spo0J
VATLAHLTAWMHPENPRRISEHDFGVLSRSLETFGWVENIVLNLRSRKQGWPKGSAPGVVSGHQRIRAESARHPDTSTHEVPVLYVDVNAKRERELMLVLNRNSGTWEPDDLERFLRALEVEGGDLTLTGFTEHEIKGWLGRLEETAPGSFPTPTEDTTHQCPKCGYRWKQ